MSHNPETSHTGNTAGSLDLAMMHDHINQLVVLAQRANKSDDHIAMFTLYGLIFEKVDAHPTTEQVDVVVQGLGDTRHDVWIQALIDCDGTVLHTFDPIKDCADTKVKLWDPSELYAWFVPGRPSRPHAVALDIDRMLDWMIGMTHRYS